MSDQELLSQAELDDRVRQKVTKELDMFWGYLQEQHDSGQELEWNTAIFTLMKRSRTAHTIVTNAHDNIFGPNSRVKYSGAKCDELFLTHGPAACKAMLELHLIHQYTR